jgi:hypothetical protein
MTRINAPEAPAQISQEDQQTILLLAQNGIETALIIDDAYDPVVRDEYQNEIAEFWDRIIRDDESMAQLRQLKPGIAASEEIDDELLGKLWEDRGKLPPKLQPPVKDILFANKIQKRAPLDELAEHLRRFSIRPDLLGSEEPLPEQPYKLVFLDYFLGIENDVNAVGIATNRAGDIYHRSKEDAGKPFIVLMSSSPDADAAKENFRKASGLLAGLFGYVPKGDLKDLEKLRLKLTSWALGLPARHDIQRFVEAMETAVKEAVDPFVSRLRGLALEDYVNIQWLSLQPDGHPLGDYMVWLYKSLLGHLVHGDNKVQEQQKMLDGMSFDKFLPAQGRASIQLADLYRCAITEPGVEDVGAHPRSPAGSMEPYLRLGDLFFKPRSKEVLLVINAACDLAYSPGAERKFPRDHAVLFARGTAGPLDEDPKPNCPKTEPFSHEGKVIRLTWDPKRVIAHDYGVVWDWLKKEKFARVARLGIAYALEVQQAFASNLTRVGMPVKPPGWHVDVDVYCDGGLGQPPLQLGESLHDGAFIMRTSSNGKELIQFVLTVECVTSILNLLDDAIAQYRQQQVQLEREVNDLIGKIGALGVAPNEEALKQLTTDKTAREGRVRGFPSKLQKLEQLKSETVVWAKLQAFQPLPSRQKAFEADKKLLWIWRDGVFTSYTSASPIAINLRLSSDQSDLGESEEHEPAAHAVSADQQRATPAANVDNASTVVPGNPKEQPNV